MALQAMLHEVLRDCLAAAREVHRHTTATRATLLVDEVMTCLLPRLCWRVPGLDEPVILPGLMDHLGASKQLAPPGHRPLSPA